MSSISLKAKTKVIYNYVNKLEKELKDSDMDDGYNIWLGNKVVKKISTSLGDIKLTKRHEGRYICNVALRFFQKYYKNKNANEDSPWINIFLSVYKVKDGKIIKENKDNYCIFQFRTTDFDISTYTPNLMEFIGALISARKYTCGFVIKQSLEDLLKKIKKNKINVEHIIKPLSGL
jgi:hypothetical protein